MMNRTSLICKTIKRYSSNQRNSSISSILGSKSAGDFVEVKGWVKSLRNQKENVFIDVSDGLTSKRLQIFIPQALKPANLTTGSSIVASGPLKLSPKGAIELSATEIEVCGGCVVSEGYPFAPRKQYSQEYIRQYPHFRPRTNKFAALLRVRNAATLAIHNYFNSEGFILVNTPILTSNDCEGAGEVFKVVPESKEVIKTMIKEGQSEDEAYFNNKTFLTVSGQLHLEAAAHGLNKVYTFGPTFRAENSRSRLHLSEFYMIEAEIAFTDSLDTVIDCIEGLIKNVSNGILERHSDDVNCCQQYLNSEFNPVWLDKSKKFPVLEYSEAVKILESNCDQFKDSLNTSNGLTKEHELFLVEYCGNVPVFIVNWPASSKPFYMKSSGNGKVAALDLLGPKVGEIVGGSLRENDYEKLIKSIPKGNDQLDWYLDLRKFGSVPTGGFGLGFERYLQFLLGIGNIKDTIPFPRWPHNCSL